MTSRTSRRDYRRSGSAKAPDVEVQPPQITGYRILGTQRGGGSLERWLAVRDDSSGEQVVVRRFASDGDRVASEAGARLYHRSSSPWWQPLRELRSDDRGSLVLIHTRSTCSLRELRDARTPLPGEAVTILAGVLCGVADAHRTGFGCGPLSDDSVVFDNGGRPKLELAPSSSVGGGVSRVAVVELDHRSVRDLAVELLSSIATTDAATALIAELGANRPQPGSDGYLEALERSLFALAPSLPVLLPADEADAEKPSALSSAHRRNGSVTGDTGGVLDMEPSAALLQRMASAVRLLAELLWRERRFFSRTEPVRAGTGTVDRPDGVERQGRAARERSQERTGPIFAPTRKRRLALVFAAATAVVATGLFAATTAFDSEEHENGGAIQNPGVTETSVNEAELSKSDGESLGDNNEAASPPRGPDPDGSSGTATVTLSVAENTAIHGDDPLAAAEALLFVRGRCLDSTDDSCLALFAESESALERSDRLAIQGETDSSLILLINGAVGVAVVQAYGDLCLLEATSSTEEKSQPVSVLIVKTNTGWLVRDLFERS